MWGSGPRSVVIETGEVKLAADLALPSSGVGIVAFAHGSGSGRHSPRNREVAARLQRAGLGTLLLDLLSEEEERRDLLTRELRFDIPLLARRLVAAVRWLDAETPGHDVGCFGASTGAAAALIAAARLPERIKAVVSRGGRVDLAGDALRSVRAPTLLIVGGEDPVVLDLNRSAQALMRAPVRLEIIEGASHLFEEPGALERVADLACRWFASRLRTVRS